MVAYFACHYKSLNRKAIKNQNNLHHGKHTLPRNYHHIHIDGLLLVTSKFNY